MKTALQASFDEVWLVDFEYSVSPGELPSVVCLVAREFFSGKTIRYWRDELLLNPELVSADKECIDYVILHELCHLKEHNHGSAFYDLLTALMPDWEKRKEKLDMRAERRSL